MVYLKHVTGANGTTHTHDGKKDGQHFTQTPKTFFFQTLAQVIHCATMHSAFVINPTIFNTQRALAELGGHAAQAHKNHPKGSSRTSQTNSDSHACNVTQTYRRRQSSRQSLEMRNLTGSISSSILSTGGPEG